MTRTCQSRPRLLRRAAERRTKLLRKLPQSAEKFSVCVCGARRYRNLLEKSGVSLWGGLTLEELSKGGNGMEGRRGGGGAWFKDS